ERKVLNMKTHCHGSRLALRFAILLVLAGSAHAKAQSPTPDAEVTLKGSMVCSGACIPDPKAEDHVMVVFASDGPREIREEVGAIIRDFYPDKGLDGDAAQKLMDQFSARLKFYIAPDSPALSDTKNRGENHYCMPALASAVTGAVTEKDGKKWITATH